MPLAELTLTRGSLNDVKLGHLAREITDLLVVHQGARPDSWAARSITWFEVTELAPNRVFVGGEMTNESRYRITFTIPEGAMDEARKASLVETSTRAILAAEGSAYDDQSSCRVWCIFQEVPDGNWASSGRIYRWRDIIRWVLRRDIAARRAGRGAPDGAAAPFPGGGSLAAHA